MSTTDLDVGSLAAETADGLAGCIRNYLEDVRFAYVFGSVARGNAREQSDLDVAVDAGRALSAEERFQLAGRLERVSGRPGDVLDLTEAGPAMRMQVLEHGEALICDDRTALAEFEMYTPTIYEDWRRRSRAFEDVLSRQFQP